MANWGKKGLGWRRKVLLAALALSLLLVAPFDNLNLTPTRALAWTHLFSLVEWEVANLPRKWTHLLREALPGRGSSRAERLASVDEYLKLARLEKKARDRVEGQALRGSGAVVRSPARDKAAVAAAQENFEDFARAKEQIRPEAEEAIEAELSAVLADLGFDSRIGLLFPPVDVRFEEPPTVLITSPRDRIELLEAVLLSPDIRPLDRDRIETRVLEEVGLSAFVDDLGGLATYPTLVSDLDTRRSVLQTAAHEWLHAYLFFRPFGYNFRRSEEMFTLNETVADVAGRELGDLTFARMGGDLGVSPGRYLPPEERDPFFTREMRETRRHVDELLAEGDVEGAERYMKERWWFFRLGGYSLRKLNQAYFAFRGRYAEGPASVSPIGDQVRELRELLPDVGSFIKAVSPAASYAEFLDLLEQLRAERSAAATSAR